MTPQPARHESTRHRGALFARDLVIIVVIAVIASLLIKTFLIQSFYIPSPSMENTLQGDPGHHDRILVDRLVPSVIPLQRGDVVVFTDPGGWLADEVPSASTPSSGGPLQQAFDAVNPFGTDSNDHLVKRVIGLPGDRVACCNAHGQMTVNGTALDEPYVRIPAGQSAASRDPFTALVPAGKLWVMGDNRNDSSDSRYQGDTPSKGFVPITNVTGRAFVVSWPVSRWSWLSDYPGTFGGVRSPSAAG